MSQSFAYAYFLGEAEWNSPDSSLRVNAYEVTKVVPIIGNVPLSVPSKICRVESFRRLTAIDALPPHLFSGVTQHLQYTGKPQRNELLARGIEEQLPSPRTITVIIPIRKSQGWWDLAQDERIAFYQKSADGEGHTAIGLPYVSHIFRRLYHCRYLESAGAFDFITYFEFQAEHTEEFLHLLQSLRDVNENPEWAYVDAEAEIWARKII